MLVSLATPVHNPLELHVYSSSHESNTGVSGSSPNVCLNPSVTSLLDANANVVLVCTNNTYVASLCQANEGCQNGACVNLVGPSNVASVTSATTTSPPLASVGVGLPCTFPITNTLMQARWVPLLTSV